MLNRVIRDQNKKLTDEEIKLKILDFLVEMDDEINEASKFSTISATNARICERDLSNTKAWEDLHYSITRSGYVGCVTFRIGSIKNLLYPDKTDWNLRALRDHEKGMER